MGKDSGIVSKQKFSLLLEENNRIIRILVSIINKLKDKQKKR
jgi:hypothetical protein